MRKLVAAIGSVAFLATLAASQEASAGATRSRAGAPAVRPIGVNLLNTDVREPIVVVSAHGPLVLGTVLADESSSVAANLGPKQALRAERNLRVQPLALDGGADAGDLAAKAQARSQVKPKLLFDMLAIGEAQNSTAGPVNAVPKQSLIEAPVQ